MFRTAYSVKDRVQTDVSGPSMTKQSFKDECDINVIMARYEKSGAMLLSSLEQRDPRYLDTTGFDYHQAMLRVAEANSLFMELPAALRDRFKNDPHELLAFLDDESNRDEAIELGLARPREAAPEPVAVRVVPEPAKV